MAAVPALIWFWFLLMNSDAAPAEVITAHSGGAVLMTCDLRLSGGQDVRWTHPHLVMSLGSNRTRCHHGRCELLSDGSLRFSRVQPADAGTYTLQVFDEDGTRLEKKDFVLRVDGPAEFNSSVSAGGSSVLVSTLICCLLLPLLLLLVFIMWRRRRRRSRSIITAGTLEENVYVTMHGHHGNNRKDEEKQEREEEESPYVPFHPVVTVEAPITEQMSADADDVSV